MNDNPDLFIEYRNTFLNYFLLDPSCSKEAINEFSYAKVCHVGKWGSGRTRQEHGYASNPTTMPTGSSAERVIRFEKNNPEKRIGLFLRQAVRFIEENKNQPFFCMFSPSQVHTGLEVRQDLVEKYNHRFSRHRTSIHPIYAAMVEAFDESVGLLLETLDTLHLIENTVVVVCSDNGGVLNERNYVPGGWEENVTNNWPLRSEKGSLYEGGIRIPLIVRWPGHVDPGSESSEPVACYDFLPTFADISGTNIEQLELDGLSLKSVLEQSGQLNRDALYWHYPRYHHSTPSSAIISGRYKLIHFYEDGRNELYDLESNIGERFNLAEAEPAKRRELKGKLDAWLNSVDAAIPQPNPDYEPAKEVIWGTRDKNTWYEQLALPL